MNPRKSLLLRLAIALAERSRAFTWQARMLANSEAETRHLMHRATLQQLASFRLLKWANQNN